MIIFCDGVFDWFHHGHVNHFKNIKELYPDSFLLVGVLNDLEALKFAGLSASPVDTPILNYYKPDFITNKKSGEGAFRDLVELILKSQNIPIAF